MDDHRSPAGPILAVDIGGTKMEAALVRPDGTLSRRARVATAPGPADVVWEALVGILTPLLAGGAVAVGVGCGGPMTAGGEEVSPLNIPGWRGFPLRTRLARLSGLAVAVDNDAKALALAEGRWGAARGVDDYLAMVVSTGVGGGLVSGGHLLDGAAGNAGHIGHLVVEPDGRPCACGARGCLEAEASGTAIAAITGRAPVEAPLAVRRRTGTLVGRAVGSVANLLDLRLAVVAGSVALGFGEDFFGPAQAELDRRARLAFSRGAQVVPGGCGGEGPLLGAAAVAWASMGSPSGPSR